MCTKFNKKFTGYTVIAHIRPRFLKESCIPIMKLGKADGNLFRKLSLFIEAMTATGLIDVLLAQFNLLLAGRQPK